MKSLWAPWRFTYIKGGKPPECIFCLGPPSQDRRRHILYRGRSSYVIMNAFPYSNGHLMVAPYRHLKNLDGFSQSVLGELLTTARLAMDVLGRTYAPEGFNVGLNLGKVAGAGIEEHLHLHIVPRWSGDTNFMSSVADVRVIPEGLDHAYQSLLPLFHPRSTRRPRAVKRSRR